MSSGESEASADCSSLTVDCTCRAERSETRLSQPPPQGMLLEPRPSLSADMDFTSSSTQRTSEATCSARTS